MIQFQSKQLVVFESRFYRTTSSLLIQVDHYILVDPNWHPEELTEINNFVAKHCIGKKGYLIFTHADYDHILGYPLFKDCTTIASHAFVHLRDPDKCLKEIATFDAAQNISRDYELEYPSIDIVITHTGQKVKIGSQVYIFYLTPGHTVDGLSFYCEKSSGLFVGDHLSDVEFPFVGDSLFFYQHTLNTFQEIIDYKEVSILVPGHGSVVTSYEVMNSRVEESHRYLLNVKDHLTFQVSFDWEEITALYPVADELKSEHEANLRLIGKELGNGETD